jgi:putative transposase
LHLRVKDKHATWLSSLAREVNFVFNYCNDLSSKVFERERRFLSGFDLWPFLEGRDLRGLRVEVGSGCRVEYVQNHASV